MPDVRALCVWLENTHLGLFIGQSGWLFPVIEMIHLFGIVALVGATSIMDLRLMGVMLQKESVTKLVSGTLRWAWIGFTTMIVTGILMFVSEATKCYDSIGFRVKMVLMILAGINVLAFHLGVYRRMNQWDQGDTPFSAKMAGAFSILIWFGIVGAGRWIGFL